jgi:hypothetical protein
LLIIKIAEAVPSIKLKIKTNVAFPPKIAREFLFALARLARLAKRASPV